MKTRMKLVALAVMSATAAFAHGEGLEDKVKFNGFISVGLSKTEEPTVYNRVFDDKNWSHTQQSRMGLQMLYKMDEETSVTAQLVARAAEDFRPQMEWGYLTRKLTDNTMVRFGRMRTPFYVYSESLEVGIAYPWTRPPEDVYNVPISGYTGATLQQNFEFGEFGDWTGNVALWGGNGQQQRNFLLDATIEFRNAIGVNGTLSYGDYSIRAGYAGTDFTMDFERSATLYQNFNTALKAVMPAGDSARIDQRLHGEFGGVGFQYDNGSFFFLSEVTDLRYDNGVFDGRFGTYASTGYRFGKLTPYFTIGKYQTTSHSSDKRKQRVAAALRAKQTALNTQFTTSLPNVGLIAAVQSLADNYRQTGDSSQSSIDAQTQLETALKGALTTSALDPIAPSPSLQAVADSLNCEATCQSLIASSSSLSTEVKNYIASNGTTIEGNLDPNILDSVAVNLKSSSANLDTALRYFGNYPEQISYTVGFRYDITPRVAFKAQTTFVDEMNGSTGLFDPSLGDANRTKSLIADGKGRLYSLSIDAVF